MLTATSDGLSEIIDRSRGNIAKMSKLTRGAIDALKPHEKNDVWLWDSELPGFGVRVQPSGRRLYVVRYKVKDANRTQRKMVLCRYQDAAPEKARGMAREVFQAVARGEDPAAERAPEKKPKPTVTVEDLFTGYVTNLRDKGKASAEVVEYALLKGGKNAADALGRTKHPAAVTSADVVSYVARFYREGHRGAADKARGYIQAAYNWALRSANDYTTLVRRDWGITMNPATSVAKDHGAIKERNRNLNADEIRQLWQACDDHTAGFTEGTEVCIRMMLACGQRVQETLRLCGRELDLDAATWTLPAAKTKGKKRDHTIPLPAIIVPHLRALKDKHGDGTLFPARPGSAHATLRDISVAHAVARWLAMDGVEMEKFQTRDLRRSWKSRAHDAGIDRFTRDLIQQHAKNDTGSKNYDRANYLPQMTEAMEKWSAWLEACVYPTTAPVALIAYVPNSVNNGGHLTN